MNLRKVLVTGANGQLGYELQQTVAAGVELIATDYQTLDITNAAQIAAALEQHQPDLVINAAAYTAVDKAESDQANAQRLNGDAAGLIAQAVAQANSRKLTQLVHISTDFVFDGSSSLPYATDATPA
ncbi:MAG TPA: sugar nucleotide-binding protein, partial [Thiolinea sp.]|nr:sugar nucleotide-binding protein [Thiolinea sp.]